MDVTTYSDQMVNNRVNAGHDRRESEQLIRDILAGAHPALYTSILPPLDFGDEQLAFDLEMATVSEILAAVNRSIPYPSSAEGASGDSFYIIVHLPAAEPVVIGFIDPTLPGSTWISADAQGRFINGVHPLNARPDIVAEWLITEAAAHGLIPAPDAQNSGPHPASAEG